jgi:hypothetical protein
VQGGRLDPGRYGYPSLLMEVLAPFTRPTIRRKSRAWP